MQPKTSVLLSAAKDDVTTLLLDGLPERSFGQHAQGAIEKYLKALILEHGKEPPYTHDLESLSNILNNLGDKLPVTAISIDTLTDYALSIRYEDISLFSVLDRSECISTVATVGSFVEMRIKQINDL